MKKVKRPIPKRIRDRGMDLVITVMKCDGDLLPHDARGRLDLQAGTIYIDVEQTLEAQWQTLWHELTHPRIMTLLEGTCNCNHEEFIVDTLAGWAFDVTRQMGMYE